MVKVARNATSNREVTYSRVANPKRMSSVVFCSSKGNGAIVVALLEMGKFGMFIQNTTTQSPPRLTFKSRLNPHSLRTEWGRRTTASLKALITMRV